VIIDPATLSDAEKERLVRGYIQVIWKNIGPRQDIPAPDVGTTPQMMGWMMTNTRLWSASTPPAFSLVNRSVAAARSDAPKRLATA